MSTPTLAPFRLAPFFSPRPWGRRDLSPWYTSQQTGTTKEPIGESWLTGPQATAETGPYTGKTLQQIATEETEALLGDWRDEREFPLLLKLLFPDDKLSVQVHPDDAAAQRIGQPRGKTECWYTLAAEPGAAVFCGLRPGTTAEQLRASVADNSMESYLQRIELHVGDMVFVDAGTVHGIGPGLTLLETQQTSDTTYRMYDYGRPRELHLEQGIGVMKTETQAGLVSPQPLPTSTGKGQRLIKQHYFTVDRFDLSTGESLELADAIGKPHCIVPISGTAKLLSASNDPLELAPGKAVVVPASVGTYTVAADTGFAFVRSTP